MIRRLLRIALCLTALATGPWSQQAAAQTRGVILVSTSADRNGCMPPTSIGLHHEGGSLVLFGGHAMNSPGKSHFPTHWGHVKAWTVTPGRYLVEVDLHSQKYAYRNNNRLKDIRLNGGEVVYIGDVAVQGCGWVKITVTNKWNQVRAKFIETYPDIDFKNVKIDMIKITSATYEPYVSIFGSWQPVRRR